MMDSVGLIVVFLEQRVRGSHEIHYVVQVTEEGTCDVHVTDSWSFKSWEDLKETHPTFKSLLYEFFNSCNWAPYVNEKEIWADEVIGGEGLYDDYDSHVLSTDL
ncbi:hypothetical protein FDH34_gp473 [Serratia phage BF]|uniref:Uncharacterized protein n=2 Tax=Eneladusvirus BF TaxID=2560751 RepID=A0A7L8ZLP0_9CAUD|nr:hypothetical protein FDH34_gp473 [Serratia phage BF]AQW88972.1 hypothetical protein BF_0447 [Serratia phage BF]QOI71386.1 hypothetical protein pEaSNUABM12_00462 [Erwinia phage pEa_SNUABM_12]QXO11594.1 hypothetical protein pEaSNUABM19_00462 [Erwinia phage pEa_SNUABM_19]